MKADSYEAAPFIVKYFEQFHAVLDSLGLCFFASNWLDLDGLFPKDVALITSSALGQDLSVEDLMLIGKRIHNVEKAFNVRHAGFSRKDDYPPERLMKEPIKSGPGKGELLDREKWDAMLERYYGIH
jgi:aldehyde:ferredoxin oxidoreductase